MLSKHDEVQNISEGLQYKVTPKKWRLIIEPQQEATGDPPSQATLCWQGQKRTSRASSEQMRHSLGPGGVGRTRLVMVLGVVWTRRRLALLRPCPHVMACRRCSLERNTHSWWRGHHTPTSRESAAPFGRPVPVFLREALDELQHAAVGHQIQGALAFVVGVVDIGALLCEETGDGRANAQLGVPQKTRGVELRVTWGKKDRRRETSGYLEDSACVCVCACSFGKCPECWMEPQCLRSRRLKRTSFIGQMITEARAAGVDLRGNRFTCALILSSAAFQQRKRVKRTSVSTSQH